MSLGKHEPCTDQLNTDFVYVSYIHLTILYYILYISI